MGAFGSSWEEHETIELAQLLIVASLGAGDNSIKVDSEFGIIMTMGSSSGLFGVYVMVL
jgi:hypothetical protein